LRLFASVAHVIDDDGVGVVVLDGVFIFGVERRVVLEGAESGHEGCARVRIVFHGWRRVVVLLLHVVGTPGDLHGES